MKIFLYVIVAAVYSDAFILERRSRSSLQPPQDAVLYADVANLMANPKSLNLKRLWVGQKENDGGAVTYNHKTPRTLEVAATPGVTNYEHKVGAFIIETMTFLMPRPLFERLAEYASVGLFTSKETTTIFPEYDRFKDRPECKDSCADKCSDTCTTDGRKYDSLSGLGGARTTCINDNFMCYPGDPYLGQYNVLVHEFGHTVHSKGLSGFSYYYDKVKQAYSNALRYDIWNTKSYEMSNELEYFAEATAAFFQTNELSSSGYMNRCGRSSGFCQTQLEARNWLEKKDPMLYEILSYTYTDFRPNATVENLGICVTKIKP